MNKTTYGSISDATNCQSCAQNNTEISCDELLSALSDEEKVRTAILELGNGGSCYQRQAFADHDNSCSSLGIAEMYSESETLHTLVSIEAGSSTENLLDAETKSPKSSRCEKAISTITCLIFSLSLVSTIVGMSCVECQNFNGLYSRLCENNSSSDRLDPEGSFCTNLMERDNSCRKLESTLSELNLNLLDPNISIGMTLIGSLFSMLSMSAFLLHSSFRSKPTETKAETNNQNAAVENANQASNPQSEHSANKPETHQPK